jgi:hypothetical protein
MNNSINLKDLWNNQSITPVAAAELLQKTNSLKNAQTKRLWGTTALLVATSLFIIWIWVKGAGEIKYITTHVGIALSILAMVIYGVSYNQHYPLLEKIDVTQSNTIFLQHLIALRKKQHFLQTTMLSAYYLLLGAGILLYMIEPTQHISFFWTCTAYSLTIAWILFNWFYTRPRNIKKQNERINAVIQHLEGMNNSLMDAK